MAAMDTFDWYVSKFYPSPDRETEQRLRAERTRLLDTRNEDMRKRFVDALVARAQADAKR